MKKETCLIVFFEDMMATDEWHREVVKHENIIKELEKKYEKKCKDLKVLYLLVLFRKKNQKCKNPLLLFLIIKR